MSDPRHFSALDASFPGENGTQLSYSYTSTTKSTSHRSPMAPPTPDPASPPGDPASAAPSPSSHHVRLGRGELVCAYEAPDLAALRSLSAGLEGRPAPPLPAEAAAFAHAHPHPSGTAAAATAPPPAGSLEALLATAGVDPDRAAARQDMMAASGDVEPQGAVDVEAAISLGMERVLGTRDLLSINFLERASRVAKAVCRVTVDDEGRIGYGTGFLVHPGILMTNNHVLPSVSAARLSYCEFDYALDADFVALPVRKFGFLPDDFFVTDATLDFTLIRVQTHTRSEFGRAGFPLSRFPVLPLTARSGKALAGEWVTIIQHPNGKMKQIVLRENQVLTDDVWPPSASTERFNSDMFINYKADTEPGSSGSPVLNDQLQLVALHHLSVPKFDDQGRVVAGEWVANQGVRISAIVAHLRQLSRPGRTTEAAVVAREILPVTGVYEVPDLAGISSFVERTGGTRSVQPLTDRPGYDPSFIPGTELPFPTADRARAPILPTAPASSVDRDSSLLHYRHFSISMDKHRRFPQCTAVNIDGSRLRGHARRDPWALDRRMGKEYQVDLPFYKKSLDLGRGRAWLARGHMVRRLDPSWGPDSRQGDLDTFFMTNSCPQAGAVFNSSVWNMLEDSVLFYADNENINATVFTGPIFYDAINFPEEPYPRFWDPELENNGITARIPCYYFKILAFKKRGKLRVLSFVMDQEQAVLDRIDQDEALGAAESLHLSKAKDLDDDELKTHQVSLAVIEHHTNQRFSADMHEADPMSARARAEEAAGGRPIVLSHIRLHNQEAEAVVLTSAGDIVF